MNVLSLFDGMSCGRLALNSAGVWVDSYFASEIDPDAIWVTQRNFPDTAQVGDVSGVSSVRLPQIYLLIGGSPCQGFSLAGEGRAFEDPRSRLFFEWVRVWRETKPRYWLLENTPMLERHEQRISNILGVEPYRIDSAGYCAQSRRRLYWTNLPRPKPKIDSTVVADVLDFSVSKGRLIDSYLLGLKKDPSYPRLLELRTNYRVTHPKNKPHPVLVSEVVGDTPSSRSRQADRIYSTLSKSPTLLANRAQDLKFDVGGRYHAELWRTISPVEAERLQTVPEGYTSGLSDAKRFKMLGNGWTVKVLADLFAPLKKNSDLI